MDLSQELGGGRNKLATHCSVRCWALSLDGQHSFHMHKDKHTGHSDQESKTGFEIKVYLLLSQVDLPAAHHLLRKTGF